MADEPSAMESTASEGQSAIESSQALGVGGRLAEPFGGQYNKLILASIVCCILTFGVIIATVLFYTADVDEGNEEGSNEAKASTTVGGPGAGSSTSPGVPSRRPVYCVIGEKLVEDVIISSGSCDYVIYPDLAFVQDEFQVTEEQHSWDVFNQARKQNPPKFVAGASFRHAQPTDPTSTVSQISKHKNKISGLVNSGFYALGFLDVPVHKDYKVDVLKDALKVFSHSLSTTPKFSRTFLGVRFYTLEQAETFAEDVMRITVPDVIIIQVHNAGKIEDENECHIHHVTYTGTEQMTAKDARFTYANAIKAIETIRSKGFTGGVALSCSMGAMIYYAGPKENYEIKQYGQTCKSASLKHVGVICELLGKPAKVQLARKVSQAFVNDSSGHESFYIADDIFDKWKGTPYLNASNGWAIFNVEQDVYGDCQGGKKPGELVALLANATRSLP